MTNLRVLLHVAAQRDYELHSLDFTTPFLQGSLQEEIWLRRPPGFTEPTTLASLGFPPATADPSLFLRTDTLLLPFYVLVYVDDLIFATADTEALTLVKSELQKRHTCTELGELRSYLGLQITRDRAQRTITLTQSHMVHEVLQRFGFQFSSPQPTPLSTSHLLYAPPSDESVEPSGLYPELVGCILYLMTCTRPDLAYPLSLLARYVAPGRHQKVHWDAAKRVLRYLCSTSGLGLVLGGRGPVVLTDHADASWVDDLATQRSSQGYTFSLGSGSVSWQSTRSSSVLSSSCEAEIYAGAMAAQELRWLTYLLTNLGEQPRSPPVLYVDNKAMIALCQEHRLEHRTKHIALRYFLARELQQRGQLRLAYVATRANTADVFPKALPPVPLFCAVRGAAAADAVLNASQRSALQRVVNASAMGVTDEDLECGGFLLMITCDPQGRVTGMLLPYMADVPSDIVQLSRLESLSMEGNGDMPSLPSVLGSITSLTRLNMVSAASGGIIPPSFIRLKRLRHLVLMNNNLAGPIPAFLSSLTALTHLSLGSNQLTLSIPARISRLQKLVTLDLSRNQISGSLSPLTAMPLLSQVNLEFNLLGSTLPSTISKLKRLTEL
ncbi:unnamed protein product, partial [Closterium sp. NIES-54]